MNAPSLGSLGDATRSLMKVFFILLISAGSLLAALPDTHPLRHPKASVITRPLAWGPDGGILINQVIRYILTSEDEATAARALLDASGYGASREHYFWVSTAQDRFIADGRIFESLKDSKEYFRANSIRTALYVEEASSFPKSIPAEFTSRALALWALDWRK